MTSVVVLDVAEAFLLRVHKLEAVAVAARVLACRASGPVQLYGVEQGSVYWEDWQNLHDALDALYGEDAWLDLPEEMTEKMKAEGLVLWAQS